MSFYHDQVWRASLTEVLGTALLVFALDTIVISSIQTDTIIAILLLATFPISGGHINPLVTFSAALIGHMTITRAAIYILAQCVGGVFGALAPKAVVSTKIEHAFSLGGRTLIVVEQQPNGPVELGLDTGVALWLEIFCSFVFLFASMWMAFDERQAKALARVSVCIILGVVLGLLIFVSTTVTAQKGYGGAGRNPARCLGPAFVRGGHLWDRHWVFWAGPATACVAFALYIKLIPSQHLHTH
ncbi:hypothetical protein KPL70_023022 [Citrus sinensis]|nr:probable aquaporin PIP2-6 [Citrus x clementina]XP_052288568.1 probable aquaporin PIP2-6 [Citrus sinensis]KAH9657305.1 hypothetical protein KPL70_023022 [Citrus sinensis]